MNIDGTVLPPVLDAFVAGEIGDFALSDVSQTSSGRMSENSRKTRSQDTRLDSAVVNALTRALCSPASCCCAAVGPGGGGGSAWNWRLRSSSLRCCDATLPLPIMNIAPRTASTSSPVHPPTTTGRLSFVIVR